jgi:Lon protease-like protein
MDEVAVCLRSAKGLPTMDFDPESIEFSNHCRLFPLPDLVLFPHALLPLHIFEPRYRQMTADALAGDGLVTMVQIRPAPEGSPPWAEPVPIMDVGCLGKIIEHEQLPDGRFNIVLLGWKRVRLQREKRSEKLYRVAEAEIIEDLELGESPGNRRGELTDLFRTLSEKRNRLDENFRRLLDSGIPLGVLSDIIAHALRLPSQVKQALLAERNVGHRVEALCTILHQIVERDRPERSFPPPFSLN